MDLVEKIDEYLNERVKQLDAVKVVREDGEYRIKFKGMGQTLGPHDGIQFKDTANVKKAGFEPETGGDIVKVNKNGTVTVEANTEKRENVKKTLTLDDIYYEIE